jgi:hypothetical protein
MPLAGLEQFTVEMIYNPYSGGNFEQRFLHCGEANGDRLLLELRSTPGGGISMHYKNRGKWCYSDRTGSLHPTINGTMLPM